MNSSTPVLDQWWPKYFRYLQTLYTDWKKYLDSFQRSVTIRKIDEGEILSLCLRARSSPAVRTCRPKVSAARGDEPLLDSPEPAGFEAIRVLIDDVFGFDWHLRTLAPHYRVRLQDTLGVEGNLFNQEPEYLLKRCNGNGYSAPKNWAALPHVNGSENSEAMSEDVGCEPPRTKKQRKPFPC